MLRHTALTSLLLLAASGLAGAQLTVTFQPRMGEPLRGVTPAQLAAFEAGRVEFEHELLVGEGLGPIFNDNSCSGCHSGPVVGGASLVSVQRFGKAAAGPDPFDPLTELGGSLRQEETIQVGCEEVVPPEADVLIERTTPHTFGSGLLEAVPDAQIVANATNPPSPDVSGIVRMVSPVEGGPDRAGRFGWKGGVATVLTFSADASLNELGLTNRFFGTENAPNGDLAVLAACDGVLDPEDTEPAGSARIDRQTDFQRLLAPPPQTPPSGMSGEAVFEQVGCDACHVRDFTTVSSDPVLDGVAIRPYSDFLLHDMGALGDGIVDGIATEQEMMTRALWGMGMREGFMHDGRATGGTFEQNVDQAILEHDGEAAASRDAYDALTQLEKDQLHAFLASLGRPEFDVEGNNSQIDEFDWFFLEPLVTGPQGTLTPDDAASIGDVDVDGDLDLVDLAAFQRAFTGLQ